MLSFRLFLGVVPKWRKRSFTFLGMDWSYERSVFYKGFECFYESGPQTLLHTYVQMRTRWVDMQALQALLVPLKKGYILNGGNLLLTRI